MKTAGIVLLLCILLGGCSGEDTELERGMALRTRLLQASEVTFSVDIAADYGDRLDLFSMDCTSTPEGKISFAVTAPETVEGITGTMDQGNGALTFGDTALQFDLLTDEQLSPVSAPWVLLKTLRAGYLNCAGMEGDLLRLTIDDSYEEDALQLDIWLNGNDLPQRAEVLYDGRNILSMEIKDFQIL